MVAFATGEKRIMTNIIPPSNTANNAAWRPCTHSDLRRQQECQGCHRPPARMYARRKPLRVGILAVFAGQTGDDLGALPGSLAQAGTLSTMDGRS